MTTQLVTIYKFNKNKYQLPIFKNAPMNAYHDPLSTIVI
jgi:hypothetical protein